MIIDWKRDKNLLEAVIIITIFLLILLFNSKAKGFGQMDSQNENKIAIKALQQNLEDIPEYGVFDWIEFEKLSSGKLILNGYAIFLETKQEAERAAKETAGVNEVENKIEVLPNSRIDNKIRNIAWAKIEKNPKLEDYVEAANPMVHIIVNRREVTLFGQVNNKSEAELFGVILKGIPNVLSVRNYLQIK